MCGYDQYVYAVGGYDGTNQLPSVERYSVETDQWQMFSPMNWPRSALSLAVVNSKIYALGEWSLFIMSMERYTGACPLDHMSLSFDGAFQ